MPAPCRTSTARCDRRPLLANALRSAALVAWACLCLAPAANAAPPEASTPAGRTSPNIVVIFADDLGYGDLGCYQTGSKVPTPHLDRLAAGGMRFTQAYCPDAVCTPSRYAMMTGRYYFRATKNSGVLANWEGAAIEPARLTLPKLLQQAGYRTAGIGKWHLGAKYTTLDGKAAVGRGQFKSARTGVNLDLRQPILHGPTARGFDTWYGFVCASETLIFQQDRPVAWLQSIYPRIEAPGAERLEAIPVADYLPRITTAAVDFVKQAAGPAKTGEKPFFLYFAPYVPHIPLAVAEDFRGKTAAGEYGDYVAELDHYVGQVLAALDEHGVADNTLVLFASDNGSQWPDSGEGHRPNGPLRGTKWQIYEGGVRTPLIARWPGRIAAGAATDELAALTDILATCAAVSGQALPAEYAEDSLDLSPILLGQKFDAPLRKEVVSRASSGDFALRQGPWKYIATKSGDRAALYHLADDPGETKDVLAANPEIAAQLKSRLIELKEGTPTRGAAKSGLKERGTP